MQPEPAKSVGSSTQSSPESLRLTGPTALLGAPLGQDSSTSSLHLGRSFSSEKKAGDSESSSDNVRSSDLSARIGASDSGSGKGEKKGKKQDISKYNRVLMEILDKIVEDKRKKGSAEVQTELTRENQTKDREISRKNLQRCKDNIELYKAQKITLDDLWEEFAKISGRHEFLAILPQVCEALQKMADADSIFNKLIEKMVHTTDKGLPFRDNHPGLLIFGYTLTQKITRLLGKYPFASQAFLAILKIKAKDLDVISLKRDLEVEVSPEENEKILQFFLESMNKNLLKQPKEKRAEFENVCSILSMAMIAEKFDPTKTHLWVLQVVILRCINLEVTEAAVLLQESTKHNVYGKCMKQFVAYMQKTLNLAIEAKYTLSDEYKNFANILLGNAVQAESGATGSSKEKTDAKVSGFLRMKSLFGSMHLTSNPTKE